MAGDSAVKYGEGHIGGIWSSNSLLSRWPMANKT